MRSFINCFNFEINQRREIKLELISKFRSAPVCREVINVLSVPVIEQYKRNIPDVYFLARPKYPVHLLLPLVVEPTSDTPPRCL